MPTSARLFGEVPGVPLGAIFRTRQELAHAGVHCPLQAGISGGIQEGADSIVISGGYEDDIDDGDVLIYTGHGGNDPDTNTQIGDQVLTRGNLALAKNCLNGLPVRVIRGIGSNPLYAPSQGYRYDGLFSVDSYWGEIGRSGYRIWRYRLIAIPQTQQKLTYLFASQQLGVGETIPAASSVPAVRAEGTIQRIVRNTALSQTVKVLHEYICQICGVSIQTAAGPYAEGAHIRPLGIPHNGPDVIENLLCLCPNDHVRFDFGEIRVLADLSMTTRTVVQIGRLRTVPGHGIGQDYLAYHREHIASY